MPEPRPLSAIPLAAARVSRSSAILLGGLAGGLIGYALVDSSATATAVVAEGARHASSAP